MAEREFSDRAQSEFNMAVSYLNRLNQWFYLVGESRLKLDSFNWFQLLALLFSELSPYMTKDEKKNKRDEISSLNNMVVQNQKFCLNSKRITIPSQLWFALFDFELFLRDVMQKSGLQTKMKEEIDETPDEWE